MCAIANCVVYLDCNYCAWRVLTAPRTFFRQTSFVYLCNAA